MRRATVTLVFALAFAWTPSARSEAEPQSPPVQEPAKQEKSPAAPLAAHTASIWDRIRLDTEQGWTGHSLSGALPGKFEEHRDVPRGAELTRVDASFASPDSPAWGTLRGREIGQKDQTLTLDAGRVGVARTNVIWNRIPHFLANSQTLFQNAGSGVLLVDPAIRSSFQSMLDAQPPANTPPAFYDLVRTQLASAPIVTVATQDDTVALKQTFKPMKGVELHAQASRIRRNGVVPLGMGTFARFNVLTPPVDIPCASRQPSQACDGAWESINTELPAPVDFHTTAANVGFQINGAKWLAGVDFDLSRLRSPFRAITYDNPFRITDAQAAPPGSSNGRNRFVRQQTAVEPDNTDHRFTLHGDYDLPLHTQFQALFSLGKTTQNADFLPYTLNTALAVKRVGGSSNLPANFNPLDVAFLPRQSLDGDIRTQHHDYSLVSRPTRSNTFRLQYRAEDQNNHTPSIVFPGMARFGDSDWVTSNDYYGNALQNFPRSFTRRDYVAGWKWEGLRKLTVDTEYDRQTWDRNFRDVPHTTENGGKVRLDFRPKPILKVTTSFLYGDRTANTYKVLPFVFNPAKQFWEIVRNADNSPNYNFEPGVSLEPNILRRYDETNRIRKDATGSIQLQAGQKTTLSLSSGYRRDDYNKDMLGLNFEKMQTYGGEVDVTPTEQSYLFANYSHDIHRFRMSGIGHLIEAAVNGVTGCCAQYPIANTWIRNNRDALDNFTTGGSFTTADEKMRLDASYAYSLTKDQVHTFNPFPPVLSISPRTATAYNYPDTRSRFSEILLSLTRDLGHSIGVRVQYRHESYNVDDFYLNDMSTYPQGVIAPGGVPALLPRQIFLNARYGNHSANEGSIFVQYHFNSPTKETPSR